MELEEKIQAVKTIGRDSPLASEEEDTIALYLNFARDELLNHIYPFGYSRVELDQKYDSKQIQLAIILYNQEGAEGEKEHSENGVGRKYQTKEQFLASIPRKVGIPK